MAKDHIEAEKEGILSDSSDLKTNLPTGFKTGVFLFLDLYHERAMLIQILWLITSSFAGAYYVGYTVMIKWAWYLPSNRPRVP